MLTFIICFNPIVRLLKIFLVIFSLPVPPRSPTHPSNFMFFVSSDKLKSIHVHIMHTQERFCVGYLLQNMQPVPSVAPVKKTDFPSPNSYQVQAASWLGWHLLVTFHCIRFSILEFVWHDPCTFSNQAVVNDS